MYIILNKIQLFDIWELSLALLTYFIVSIFFYSALFLLTTLNVSVRVIYSHSLCEYNCKNSSINK